LSYRAVRGRPAAVVPARAGLARISLAAVLWGTTGVVARLVHASTGLGPVAIGFYRLAIAAAVLLAIGRRARLLAALRAAPFALLLTGAALGSCMALYFTAVTQVGVGVATVVTIGLAPALVAAWEAVRARRAPSRLLLASLFAALTGLAVVSAAAGGPSAAAPRPVLGVGTAALAGVDYAVYTVLGRHVAQGAGAMQVTVLSTVAGALVLVPLAVVDGVGFAVHPAPVAWLAYLGVVATAFGYWLFYAGLRTTTGSVAAVLTLLEPLAAAVLAVAVLGEPLSAPPAAGGLLMLVGIAAVYLQPLEQVCDTLGP